MRRRSSRSWSSTTSARATKAPGNTGSAHLLEHMIFNKSTENFGKANGHKTFQEVLYEAGADFASSNMTTWYDRMNGYSTLPSDKLELAMKIEADRLGRGLILDSERQPEMSVVRNEYEIGENNPAAGAAEGGRRHGDQGASVSLGHDRLPLRHRRRHDREAARALQELLPAEQRRGDSGRRLRHGQSAGDVRPASSAASQASTQADPAGHHGRAAAGRRAARRRQAPRPRSGSSRPPTSAPARSHPDFIPLDVLSTILADGVNSRLYQALVETQAGDDVGSTNSRVARSVRHAFPGVHRSRNSTHRKTETRSRRPSRTSRQTA